jgi:hypothetical protein
LSRSKVSVLLKAGIIITKIRKNMAKKSEEQTDWLGSKYTQHYDKNGSKSGRSQSRKDWLGSNYTLHTDKNGNKSGRSEHKKDWLGNNYSQNFDKGGVKSGRSESRKDWLGNSYTRHTDKNGNKKSQTVSKKDWFGNNYRSTSESSKGCYLTTVCVEHKGLADDCRELQILRNFRDEYVAKDVKGLMLIAEYYSKAPKIVKQINDSERRIAILEDLYSKILKTIELVENDENEKAFQMYYLTAVELETTFS